MERHIILSYHDLLHIIPTGMHNFNKNLDVTGHQIPLTMSVARRKFRFFTHCFGCFSNTGRESHYSFLPQLATHNTYWHAKFQQKPCCRWTSNTLHYVRRSPKISSFYALFWLLLKYRLIKTIISEKYLTQQEKIHAVN